MGNANSGGGAPSRCKHWPPGARDPRYATASESVPYGTVEDVPSAALHEPMNVPTFTSAAPETL